MRSLINHLQAQCKLHNLEAGRCKKQCKEFEEELNKLKAKQDTMMSNGLSQQISVISSETILTSSVNSNQAQESPTSKEESTNPMISQLSVVSKVETTQKEESNDVVRRFFLF